jgi:hypothetical protein
MRHYLGIAAVLAALLAGCQMNVTRGSGNVSSETREVSGFNRVQLAWVGDLDIATGAGEGLTIEAEDNILPFITSEVRDGTLIIGLDAPAGDGTILPTRPVRYQLGVDTLEGIAISGAGNVSAPALEAEQFDLQLSGAGNIEMGPLTAQRLAVDSGGAGNLSVTGQVEEQTVTLSGLGNYQAGDLESATARLTLSGAGNATVWVTDSLDVNLSGAGNVEYYGEPQVTESIGGLGRVKSLGAK